MTLLPGPGVWAMRSGAPSDAQATQFAATGAGIQAAIDYIGSGKGKVYIGPGSINFTSGLSISSASEIHIQGSGKGVTVLIGTGAISNTLTTSALFSDLTLDTWLTAVDFSGVTTTVPRISFDNVEIKNYNRAIYANNLTPGQGVDKLSIQNCDITTGTSYAIWVNTYVMGPCHVKNNRIKTCVQRAVNFGNNTVAFADIRGPYIIEGNWIESVSATTGNSINVVVCYGWRATIHGNTFKDVLKTGVPTEVDCECIFTKSRYSTVTENILIDAGQGEAWINIKGGARNETVVQPYGYSVICANNVLADTQTNPTLAGGGRKTVGIKLATSEVLCANNYLEGLTDLAIYLDSDTGSDSPCHNIVIDGNVIKDHRGRIGIGLYGRGNNIRCLDNTIDGILNTYDPSSQNTGILVAKKEGTGLDVSRNWVKNVSDNGFTPVGLLMNPAAPNFTVTADAATDTLTASSAHAFSVNDQVKFTTTGTLPAPLVVGTIYYLKTVPSTTTFTLSATLGGATIDITTAGTGTHTVFKMTQLTNWRVTDNDIDTAHFGLQYTWDETYVSVDNCITRHTTGRNINGNAIPVSTDLVKYSDSPTNLVDLPARNETVNRISNTVAEIKNGTFNQNLKIYGTDDGAGNSEDFSVRMDASHATIDVQAAGTGVIRDLEVQFGSVAFWKWVSSGTFRPTVDNSYDFGSSTIRPRDVWVGRDLKANNSGSRIYMDYTNTATIGNVTINKSSGRVNVASGTTSVVVTNNRVTAASHVLVVGAQNDATGIVKNVVSAAGSFTINMSAAPTADMAVDFVVFNAD